MRELTKKKVGYVLDYVNVHIEQNGYPPSVREICSALGFKSTSTVHIYLKALEREGKIVKAPSKPRTLRVMAPGDGAFPRAPDAFRHGGSTAAAGNTAQAAPERNKAGSPPENERRLKRQPLPQSDAAQSSNGSGNRIHHDETVYVPVLGRVTAGKPIFAVENIEYTFPVPSFFVNNASVFMLRVEGDSMINAGILDRDYILVRHQPTAQNGEIVVALIGDEATVKTFYKERNRIRLQPENELYSPIYAANNCTIVGKVIGIFRKI